MKLLSVDAPWMPLQITSTLTLAADGQINTRREASHIEPGSSATHYIWVQRAMGTLPSHPPYAIGHRCLEQRSDGVWRFCESVPVAARPALARELLTLLVPAQVVSARLADIYSRALIGPPAYPYGAVQVAISLEYTIRRPRARRAIGHVRVNALNFRGQPLIVARWDGDRSAGPAPLTWYPGVQNQPGYPRTRDELERRWRAAGMVAHSQNRAIRALIRPRQDA
jgi:hypothetical protein